MKTEYKKNDIVVDCVTMTLGKIKEVIENPIRAKYVLTNGCIVYDFDICRREDLKHAFKEFKHYLGVFIEVNQKYDLSAKTRRILSPIDPFAFYTKIDYLLCEWDELVKKLDEND
jgi:hypothetical protein